MSNELTFKRSIKKALLLLLMAVCLVALSWWMTTEKPILGWVGVVFFGLGIPVSLLMLRPNTTYLRLTQEGFDIVAMSRASTYKWADVEGFHIGQIRGAKMVGIVFSHAYEKQRSARAVASALGGMEGAIADNYTAPVEVVCATLNEWKARSGSHAI